jgi:ATP-dependent DNA helicase RecG
MIQENELLRLLAEGEADRIERTISTKDTDKFSEAVTAFANDLPNHRLPGYLVIGVNDDGTPSGLQVSDQLLQNLGALRSDGNIQPLPAR